jgi:pimeloyl-ACP methyl ester carboxylesterase
MPMKTQTAAVLEAVSSRIVSATGDRGFESFSLQRGVTCEPDFFDRRWPAGTIRGPSAHRAQAERSAASIAILNHIADSRLVLLNNCGHWPPFEKPAEWTAQVLAFLKGY